MDINVQVGESIKYCINSNYFEAFPQMCGFCLIFGKRLSIFDTSTLAGSFIFSRGGGNFSEPVHESFIEFGKGSSVRVVCRLV